MQGVTLVELLITLSIAALLVTVGIPSFRDIIANNRLATASNDLLFGLNLAKSEAIRRNQSMRFCLDPAALTWRVSTMASTDVRVGTLPGNLSAAPRNLDSASVADNVCVRFRPNGLSYGSGNALMTDGEITLTLSGKNREISVRTGSLHVASS
jgi:type IV fimbrial biogenesis protein FimT